MPGARLILKTKPLAEAETRAYMVRVFAPTVSHPTAWIFAAGRPRIGRISISTITSISRLIPRPKDRLQELAHLVREKRERGADPVVSRLLDEIELRAEVELAKLSRRIG